MPSGSQPVLVTHTVDRPDSTVDIADLAAGTAWRRPGTLTAPAGNAWQLKVFVQNQASSQLFVDGLATADRKVNVNAYPAACASSYAVLGESAGAWPRLAGIQLGEAVRGNAGRPGEAGHRGFS